MRKAYWMVAYRSLSDGAALQAYGEIAQRVIAAGGGSVLVFSMQPVVREAGVNQLTVLVEFPSLEVAQQVYDSEDYKVSLRALGDAAERDFRIVEALA